MPVTLALFNDEIKFFESTAQAVLKEKFRDGWFAEGSFAKLDISAASKEQKKILLRRLGGYNPKILGDELCINLNEILDF